MGKTIGMLGASGAVGRRVVRHLLAHQPDQVEHVVTIDRRDVGYEIEDARLTSHVVEMRSPS